MSAGHDEDDGAGVLEGPRRGALDALLRRATLTWRYQGPRVVALRVATFPLRATPLRGLLGEERQRDPELLRARRWYRRHAAPVTVVIAGDGDPRSLSRTLRSIRRTTRRGRARIEVADPGASLESALVVADSSLDVVLVAAGLVMRRHWLAVLQHAARSGEHVAIAVPRVVRSNGHIESAGLARKGGELGRRYESKPEDYGPALVPVPVIAAERSCIYLDRRALRTVAPTGDTPDVCDQFWQTGWQIVYAPSAEARRSTHVAIPAVPDDRRAPQKRPRSRRVKLGASRDIIYVTENTAIGGGHRDVFEHLNGLAARGHRAELYTLGSAPGWFDLRVPVRSFSDYGALAGALAPLDAVKVATWWATAEPVWRASVARGIPAYFVQDIETSYYPDDQRARFRVLASYREEFRYMTISNWNRERLAELGLSAELIAPGVDLATFAPRPAIHRRRDMVLALGRTLPLKNFPLTLAAWRALSRPRPELRLFGSEPQLADEAGIVYEERPTDERVAELLCEASVFVATSTHEGFCLPVLEAMACGTPVVCTDAHGNRDFCVDGENCLMPSARAEDVAAAIARLLGDADLRRRLGQAGLETAASYSWKPRIDALERFMHGVANRDHAAAAC